MRAAHVILALLALAPLAAAQGDPNVNESDFDTTPPPDDQSYLDESEPDPTVTEGDFDTTPPAEDDAYLDEAEREIAAPSGGDDAGGEGDARSGSADAPGFGVALAVAGIAVALLVGRRPKP